MENMVRDDRNIKAINYRRKILPLISFGILVLVLSQQVALFCPSVQATHLDQEAKLNVNERQRELIRHMSEKRKKSKKIKSKKSSSTTSAKTSSQKSTASKPKLKARPQPEPAPPPPQQQQVVEQPVQQVIQQPVQQVQEQQQVEVQQPQVEVQQPQPMQMQQQPMQMQQQPSPVQQQQVQETADVQADSQQTTQQQQQSNAEVDVTQQLTQQQQVAIEAFTTAATQTDSIMIESEQQEEEKRYAPKMQDSFTPSQVRQHRSPLQLPDITPGGDIMPSDNTNLDDIAKASPEDTFAYSQVIALDDEAQAAFLKQMEPKPVNAEEDNGSMAQFMVDVSQQSQKLQQDQKDPEEQQEEKPADSPDITGADFAAELSQKYEAQQKQREAGMGVAEKIAASYWFQNSNNHQPETLNQPKKEQVSDEPDQQEAIEIDY